MGDTAKRVVVVALLAAGLGCTRQSSSDATKGGPAAASAPLLASAAAPSSAPSGLPVADTATRARCAVLCERTADLKCKHPEACLPNCLAMASATPCNEPISALFSCLTKAEIGHFQCDEQTGFAQIREGYCEQEQANAARCMEAKMQ